MLRGVHNAVPWSLNPLLLTPVFGLLGVVIGGVIAFGSSYFLDKARAKRELRCAARLIALELTSMRTTANSCVQQKIWPTPNLPPLLSLSTEARQKYLAAIAPNLPSDAWLSVAIALQAAETFKVIFGQVQDRTIAIPDDVAKTFLPLIENMDKGRRALAPHDIRF
jgi:hypothetical protein